MAPVLERLDAIPRLGIGEGPHWDPKEQVLYVVDITTGNIYCWSPSTNKIVQQNVGPHASFLIPVKGRKDEAIVSCQQELLHIKWDKETNKILMREVLARVQEPTPNIINDAKCDVTGRIWFGTYNQGLDSDSCSFYSFSPNAGLKKHESGITVSNGLAFSPDNKTMWYTDTMKYRVDQFKVDTIEGTREFEKVLIDYKKLNIPGAGDGMTVDADGNVWATCVFGSQIIQVDPKTGKILQKVVFPDCPQITSVAFGGPNMDELFVTSANILNFPGYEFTVGAPDAGATYRVTGVGVKGVAPYEFHLSS